MADIFGPICDAATPEVLNCLARTATRREAMRSFAFARQKNDDKDCSNWYHVPAITVNDQCVLTATAVVQTMAMNKLKRNYPFA